MSTTFDRDMRRACEPFERDHDRLRAELMTTLSAETPEAPRLEASSRRRHWIGRSLMTRRVFRIIPAVAAAVVLLVGVGLWLGRGWSEPGRRIGHDVAGAGFDVQVQCALDGAVLVEHLASVVSQRAVLVVWSCRGVADIAGPESAYAPAGDRRTQKYIQYLLGREQTGDGRIVVWSLFVAAEDVNPALEPPAIHVSTADGQLIVLSTSPNVGSRKELAAALQTAVFPGRSRVTLEEIERVVEKHRYRRS